MGRGDSYQLQGQQGGLVIDGSGSVDPSGYAPFRWILVVNDAVLSELSGNLDNSGDLVGPTLPAGFGFGGNITSVNLASGVIIAYYA